ncbi:Protein CBG22955 [Caenorhabditis briggsae]|uniref:Protein CBG22955 n=1 Tax=Caenorhabditis briggsae TaxID=6238 RepID=A8Y3K9_CAEBR|nr:Protein CBG22955 [Caenorhabditis briggsae]CAP39478.2 Protein CBG22955 [Caenorhabditis briggsae]
MAYSPYKTSKKQWKSFGSIPVSSTSLDLEDFPKRIVLKYIDWPASSSPFTPTISLFSANFKEGQMKEIEIKEVSYEDFGLLCSSFYPNPQFPNDSTSEKLHEMASRFQVSSVVGNVEYHLLNNSKIGYERMLWFADEYQMPKLLEKCISQMNSLAMAKKLEKSPEFEKLSDRTTQVLGAHTHNGWATEDAPMNWVQGKDAGMGHIRGIWGTPPPQSISSPGLLALDEMN